MRLLETSIAIDAPASTVWAVFDELAAYPQWNLMLPNLAGLTTVGSKVEGDLVRPNTPTMRIGPTIRRIVAARELRWNSQAPDPAVFRAEHIFRIEPRGPNNCIFHNDERFEGQVVEDRWPSLDTDTREAFNDTNRRLKERAEARVLASVALHPSLEGERPPAGGESFAGKTLRCACPSEPVEVRLSEDIAHNHLCGCSKCWRPAGYLFAQTAVVPTGSLEVTAHLGKLQVVDATQSIKRHACIACGVHLFGRVDDPDHHFFGIDFMHPELAGSAHRPKVEFAGFVSSLIESGTSPTVMASVRSHLAAADIAPFDTFSPEITDVIAWHRVKLAAAR